MTTYLLIVCVILTAFLGLCFRAYLREQDTTKDYELLLEMDQTIIEKQRNNIDQLSLYLDGMVADMVGMVDMQLHDAATIRNMTASIEALSNELDDERIKWARLVLKAQDLGEIRGKTTFHPDEIIEDDCTCVTEPNQPCRDKSCTCVHHTTVDQ